MLICNIQEFSKRVKSDKVRPLKGLSVELTRKCNFGCKHCFLGNPTPESLARPELSYEKWIDIFDQYVAEEGLFITITGGEPLLRQDFKKIWIALKKRGFLISLFTNGSLIDLEMADFLAEWTPYEVSISLYGSSEQTYEKMTGRQNMFSRIMQTLDILAEKGINLEVKSVFTRLNIDEFHQIKAIGERYCDLFRWDADIMGAFPCSTNFPQLFRLSPEECVEIEAAEPIRNKELGVRVENWNPPRPENKRKGAFSCNVGFSSAYIDAYGGLHPCLPLESLSYDLNKGSLKDGWHRAIPELLSEFPHPPGPCQTCDAFEICGQCVAFALLEGCSPTGPVPYRCRLARARALKYKIFDKINYMPELETAN